ncbi:MAG: glycosyltransferase N-terminal domain-containing protein [Paracoccus sp. (in: a-proteobacteria)]|nr:glycosyltransferase N-terminal domain-containing protein [Paracoccus sp. (in: a-proteobacteria)]
MARGWFNWLRQERAEPQAPTLALPPGELPLIWLRAGAEFAPDPETGAPPAAIMQLLGALRRAEFRVALSFAGSGNGFTLPSPPRGRAAHVTAIPDPGENAGAIRAHLGAMGAAAVLLLGRDLPARLIETAQQARLPVIMAEARLPAPPRRLIRWPLPSSAAIVSRLTRVLVTDKASEAAMLDLGTRPERVEITGPITQTRDALPYLEAEREALSEVLLGRQLWLAAAFTAAEHEAVIHAHLGALAYSHRAMLIALPAGPAQAPSFVEAAEAAGLLVAERAGDDDPTPEVNIYLCDDPAELGLWYRLAPVAFMGGTLAGAPEAGTGAARHPFEPAALGSAIIHGPQTGAFAAEWQQLDGAGAARLAPDAAGLAQAVADLFVPDDAAQLAANAWSVSTGGAGVAARIAIVVKAALRGIEEESQT